MWLEKLSRKPFSNSQMKSRRNKHLIFWRNDLYSTDNFSNESIQREKFLEKNWSMIDSKLSNKKSKNEKARDKHLKSEEMICSNFPNDLKQSENLSRKTFEKKSTIGEKHRRNLKKQWSAPIICQTSWNVKKISPERLPKKARPTPNSQTKTPTEPRKPKNRDELMNHHHKQLKSSKSEPNPREAKEQSFRTLALLLKSSPDPPILQETKQK